MWSPGIQRVQCATTATAVTTIHPIKAQATTAFTFPTRWFTLLDDITFENNAVPSPGDPGSGTMNIPREDRYTWAYMFRDLSVSALDPHTIEQSIVVYSGRPQLEAESAFPGTWNGNVVTVNFAGLSKPAIRKGSWILDNTVIGPGNTVNANGFFYRVVNVTDTSATTMDLELLTQGRRGANNSNNAFIVVMDGVVEVFDRTFSTGFGGSNVAW